MFRLYEDGGFVFMRGLSQHPYGRSMRRAHVSRTDVGFLRCHARPVGLSPAVATSERRRARFSALRVLARSPLPLIPSPSREGTGAVFFAGGDILNGTDDASRVSIAE